MLVGCQASPFSVDEKVQRVLGDTARPLSAEELELKRGTAIERLDASPRGDRLEKHPASTNPTAADLKFLPAAEDRDVAARLERYAIDAGAARGKDGESAAVAVMTLTLEDALRQSQLTGRELLTAQEDYILSSIRLLQERHLWGPRFFNDTVLGMSGDGTQGDFQHALSIINTLRANQRLPSGGSLEAAFVWNATEQLREQATGRYRQSSELVLRGNLPLLRGAGAIAREDLIQAERDLVYQSREFERFRRQYLVQVAQDYFTLIESKSAIRNQERQLEGLKRLADATAARADAGRTEAFQKQLTANRVLSATARLASLREQHILQLERFKIRLGLPVETVLGISDEIIAIPEPEITAEEATRSALEYRLDLQNSRDRLMDRRRGVDNAKNGLLPDLNLSGEVGVPTDPGAREGGANIDPEETRYDVSATLSLPLDRERERLALRAATIQLERAERDHERSRDQVVVNVRSALRAVELARFQLTLSEQQVDINKNRLRGQRLQEDTLDPQTIVDTENDLLESENQRDQARTAVRNAVLNYLLESDQLRVKRDGTLDRLSGM
jgi:outer membrane protein TolC